MGKYGKNFRDCCDSPTDGKHINGCHLSTVNIKVSLKDCFDDITGNLKFDPYRFDPENETPYTIALKNALFTEDGWLVDHKALGDLIGSKGYKWKWDCTAIGLYHAEIHAQATKYSYPTIYYFR